MLDHQTFIAIVKISMVAPDEWVGAAVFSKVVVTFNPVGGFFNLFSTTTGMSE